MFDILNSRDFYQKLLADFDDYMDNLQSARHAINCAIAAHHMHDWVWGDFLKADRSLRAKLSIESRDEFVAWIQKNSIWFTLVQEISNGSKHFARSSLAKAVTVGGWDNGKWDEAKWDQTHLIIDLGDTNGTPNHLPVAHLLEVVIRFWRDFLAKYGPYDNLPRGKTRLSDELL